MLLELLLSMAVIVSAVLLTLPQLPQRKEVWAVKEYQSELLQLQTIAMSENTKQEIDGISFNHWGHVNGGRTLNFNDKKLVLFLGMGRSEIR